MNSYTGFKPVAITALKLCKSKNSPLYGVDPLLKSTHVLQLIVQDYTIVAKVSDLWYGCLCGTIQYQYMHSVIFICQQVGGVCVHAC